MSALALKKPVVDFLVAETRSNHTLTRADIWFATQVLVDRGIKPLDDGYFRLYWSPRVPLAPEVWACVKHNSIIDGCRFYMPMSNSEKFDPKFVLVGRKDSGELVSTRLCFWERAREERNEA